MRKTLLLAVIIALFAGISFPQGATAPFVKPQFFTDAGVMCAGCSLYTYAAGTTTLTATYSNSTLTTPNANPIVLDTAGRATIFLSPVSYKFELRLTTGTVVWTFDNIYDLAQLLKLDLASTSSGLGDELIGYKATGTGTIAGTVHSAWSQFPVNVKNYLAAGQPDGTTDNTIGLQRAINDAVTFQRKLYVPGATQNYVTTGLTVPAINDYNVFEMYGDGMGKFYSNDASARKGTRIKCTAASTDCLAIVSTAGGLQHYSFSSMTLIGPDTTTPRTTTSGNGLRISGTASPSVTLRDFSAGQFYGTGKAGIWLDSVYNAMLEGSVRVEYNDIGLKLSNNSNAFRAYNLAARYNASDGVLVDTCDNGTIFGTIEYSEINGLRFTGGPNTDWLVQVYFEGNNSTDTALSSGIVIWPTGSGTNVIRDITFVNCQYHNTVVDRESPLLYGADATHFVSGISFQGGYMAGIASLGAAFRLYGNVTQTEIHSTDPIVESHVSVNTVAGFTPDKTVLISQNGGIYYGMRQLFINRTAANGDVNADLSMENRISIIDETAANDTAKPLFVAGIGPDDPTLQEFTFSISATPSATAANRVLDFEAGDFVDVRRIRFNQWAEIGDTGVVKIGGLPVYADNAAALAGGLTAGYLYRTSAGIVMVVY
jgi:hypothetical protein